MLHGIWWRLDMHMRSSCVTMENPGFSINVILQAIRIVLIEVVLVAMLTVESMPRELVSAA